MNFGINLPDIPADGMMTARQGRQIQEQLLALQEQLRYMFRNIGAENLTDELKAAMGGGEDIEGLVTRLEDAEGNILKIEKKADGLTVTVEGLEGDVSRVEQTADGLTSTVQNLQGQVTRVEQTAAGLELTVQGLAGDVSTIQLTTSGLTAAVNNNRLVFSAAGLRLINASGQVVFEQDMTNGGVTVTGIIRALGGVLGPFTVTADGLSYTVSGLGEVFSIKTGSADVVRMMLGDLLVTGGPANGVTIRRLAYGPENNSYLLVHKDGFHIGSKFVLEAGAISAPNDRRGILQCEKDGGFVSVGPKIVSGTITIGDGSPAYIDYSSAMFTQIPRVVMTYATSGANAAGDSGAIKIYYKSTYACNAIMGGNFGQTREVDWIAIGY